MIHKDEEGIGYDLVEVLSSNLHGGTEGNDKHLQDNWNPGSSFEPEIS